PQRLAWGCCRLSASPAWGWRFSKCGVRNAGCGMQYWEKRSDVDPIDPIDPMDSMDPTDAIRLDQVSFTYAEAVAPALRGVSLRVGQGEMLVILGASGAGKSTLVKCLNRIIPAFQSGRLTGEVRLFGRRLVQEKVGELAGTVGMVF